MFEGNHLKISRLLRPAVTIVKKFAAWCGCGYRALVKSIVQFKGYKNLELNNKRSTGQIPYFDLGTQIPPFIFFIFFSNSSPCGEL